MKIQHLLETPVHTDMRGSIFDILAPTEIHHVGFLVSTPGSVRGNHYHKETTQHIFITSGSMKYWYLDATRPSEDPQFVIAKAGDLVTSEPLEIHAMQMLEPTSFVVLTQGKRVGKDYESDTFRVESIVGGY